MNGLIDKFF